MLTKFFKAVSPKIFKFIEDAQLIQKLDPSIKVEFENPMTYRDGQGNKVEVKYFKSRNEVGIWLYENFDEDPLIELPGIPVENIYSSSDIIEAVKEEFELLLAHYERMFDELC